MGSPFGKMSKADWQKVGRGLILGVVGAGVSWVLTIFVPELQKCGDLGALLLAAASAAAANALRKWLTDTESK